MNPWPFFIGADGLALTPEWSTVALGAVAGDDTTEPAPSRGWLVSLDVRLSGIQGSSSVTFYLSTDEAGLELLTPNGTTGATQVISLAKDNAEAGGVSWLLARRPFAGAAIHLHAKLDAGTATGSARLAGERGSAWRTRA